MLVLGTENKEIIILDKNYDKILRTIYLKSEPVFLVCQGAYDVEYTIFVACRNGFTYKIKNGFVSQNFVVHIESKPVGLVKLDKTLIMGGIN